MKYLKILFVILIALYSCQKDDDSMDVKLDNKEYNIKAQGGDMIYGDGWIGWLDPELLDEGEIIPEDEIYKEDPKYSGDKVNVGDATIIKCPESGTNCGRLYTLPEHGGEPKYVGLYLVEE